MSSDTWSDRCIDSEMALETDSDNKELISRLRNESVGRHCKRREFSFSAHRMKLDWGAIYGIEPTEVVTVSYPDLVPQCPASLREEMWMPWIE